MKAKHFLIVPDSLKGSLSAEQAAQAISRGIKSTFPDAEIEAHPMADGGEGSSSIAAKSIGAKRVELEVIGPEGNLVTGFYYLHKNQALIELAAASGFTLSAQPTRTAPYATTFGTGELIRDAISKGATDISLFLGGSATTDGGVGIAKALSMQFFDSKNCRLVDARSCLTQHQPFPGEQLSKISAIEDSECRQLLSGITITAIVDVDNPLCGQRGSAAVYGPQKGNSPADISALDSALANLARVVSDKYCVDLSSRPGAGAAGGAGFGIIALLNGTLTPGAAFFLDLISFDEKLDQVDCVITGEGKADFQSTQGKLLGEILRRTGKGKRVVSLVGMNDLPDTIFEDFPNLEVRALKAGQPFKLAYEGLVEATRAHFSDL